MCVVQLDVVYACHGLALVVSYVLKHYMDECMTVVDTSTYNYGGSSIEYYNDSGRAQCTQYYTSIGNYCGLSEPHTHLQTWSEYALFAV